MKTQAQQSRKAAKKRPVRYSLNKNKYLLPHEREALEANLRKHMDVDTRNTLLLFLALKTGARAQEVLNLKKSNLNVYDFSVLIEGIKGSSDREIPVSNELFLRLQQYARQVEGEFLFPITYSRFRQIWDLYRPVPKKLHSLRHTFAIEIYKKTKDIRLLQVALGHRNVMNTMIYADYVYSQTELRRLIL